MATLMTVVKGLSLAQGLQIGGTLISTAGAISAGKARNAAADYNARQLEADAKTQQAVAQREAQKERKQKELMISRARAVGAASGGGQDYDLLGDIEEEGEYSALMALWDGNERAAGRRQQAASTRFEGRQAKRAGFMKGGSTLLHGSAPLLESATRSMYEKYG